MNSSIVPISEDISNASFQFSPITTECYNKGDVLSFIKKHNIDMNKGDRSLGEKCTVTSMLGFKICMTYDLIDGFVESLLCDYVRDIYSSWVMIAHESTGMRMCVDIDCENILTEDVVKELATTLHVVLTKYSSKDVKLYVSRCGPRFKKGKVSEGYHIVSNIRVSCMHALYIANRYKEQLTSNSMIKHDQFDIDESIYQTTSRSVTLRCPLSNKIETCPCCTIECKILCSLCKGKRRVISRFLYIPIGVSDVNGFTLNDECISSDIIRSHMIWSSKHDGISTIPETSIYRCTQKEIGEPRTLTINRSQMNLLEGFFGKMKCLKLSGKIIRNVKEWNNNLCVNLYSTKCPYKNKTHNSSNIWVQITPSGKVKVRCRSKKYNCCKETRGCVEYKIDPSLCKDILTNNKSDAKCIQHKQKLQNDRKSISSEHKDMLVSDDVHASVKETKLGCVINTTTATNPCIKNKDQALYSHHTYISTMQRVRVNSIKRKRETGGNSRRKYFNRICKSIL
jgi:hypothetical protein